MRGLQNSQKRVRKIFDHKKLSYIKNVTLNVKLYGAIFYGRSNNRKKEQIMRKIFVCYPRCTTCKKAETWLADHGIAVKMRDIKGENPTEQELRSWHKLSGLPLKRFFNTSGQKYREMELKDKLATMSEDEQYALLSTDGMLVKRPILVSDDFVLVGFKEQEWQKALR